MTNGENILIMQEWCNQCRTCKYWTGYRYGKGLREGSCSESEITGMGQTTSCGYCPFWETFDEDALRALSREDLS